MGALAIGKTSDQVFDRLVSGLQATFGRNAAEGLARHFIEAEGADFYWEARARERWLGAYESLEEEADDLFDRWLSSDFSMVATMSRCCFSNCRAASMPCSGCGSSKIAAKRSTRSKARVEGEEFAQGSSVSPALLPLSLLGLPDGRTTSARLLWESYGAPLSRSHSGHSQ